MFDASDGPSYVHQGAIHEQVRLIGEGENMRVIFIDWGHTQYIPGVDNLNRLVALDLKVPELIVQLRSFVEDNMIISFATELLRCAIEDSPKEFSRYYSAIDRSIFSLCSSRTLDVRNLGDKLRRAVDSQVSLSKN